MSSNLSTFQYKISQIAGCGTAVYKADQMHELLVEMRKKINATEYGIFNGTVDEYYQTMQGIMTYLIPVINDQLVPKFNELTVEWDNCR